MNIESITINWRPRESVECAANKTPEIYRDRESFSLSQHCHTNASFAEAGDAAVNCDHYRHQTSDKHGLFCHKALSLIQAPNI